jgi:hypothetical protein
MSRWLILLLSGLPMLAMAADPAQLGRLFLTPAERATLDIVRQNSRPPEKIITPGASGEDSAGEGASTPVAVPTVVTVDGYVKRTDGKGTVWVNGQPVREKSTANNVEIGRLQGNTNDVRIKLPSTGQTFKLKAGQSYESASGKVGSLREIEPVAEKAVPAAPLAKSQNKPAAESEKAALPPASTPAATISPAPQTPR